MCHWGSINFKPYAPLSVDIWDGDRCLNDNLVYFLATCVCMLIYVRARQCTCVCVRMSSAENGNQSLDSSYRSTGTVQRDELHVTYNVMFKMLTGGLNRPSWGHFEQPVDKCRQMGSRSGKTTKWIQVEFAVDVRTHTLINKQQLNRLILYFIFTM